MSQEALLLKELTDKVPKNGVPVVGGGLGAVAVALFWLVSQVSALDKTLGATHATVGDLVIRVQRLETEFAYFRGISARDEAGVK